MRKHFKFIIIKSERTHRCVNDIKHISCPKRCADPSDEYLVLIGSIFNVNYPLMVMLIEFIYTICSIETLRAHQVASNILQACITTANCSRCIFYQLLFHLPCTLSQIVALINLSYKRMHISA